MSHNQQQKIFSYHVCKNLKNREYFSPNGLFFGHPNGGVIAPPPPQKKRQNEFTGWAISKLDKQFRFTQPCFILSRSSGIRKTSVGVFIFLL